VLTADTDSECRMSGAKLGGYQILDLEDIKFNWKEHSAELKYLQLRRCAELDRRCRRTESRKNSRLGHADFHVAIVPYYGND